MKRIAIMVTGLASNREIFLHHMLPTLQQALHDCEITLYFQLWDSSRFIECIPNFNVKDYPHEHLFRLEHVTSSELNNSIVAATDLPYHVERIYYNDFYESSLGADRIVKKQCEAWASGHWCSYPDRLLAILSLPLHHFGQNFCMEELYRRIGKDYDGYIRVRHDIFFTEYENCNDEWIDRMHSIFDNNIPQIGISWPIQFPGHEAYTTEFSVGLSDMFMVANKSGADLFFTNMHKNIADITHDFFDIHQCRPGLHQEIALRLLCEQQGIKWVTLLTPRVDTQR